MLQLSLRMSMNFASRATIGCGLLCCNLLPTLITTSGFFGKSSEEIRAAGRRPRCLEAAGYRLGQHFGAPREPGVLGQRLDDLLLVGDLLEAVASRAPRLIGAVAVEDERRLLLVGVEHLPHGVGKTHH